MNTPYTAGVLAQRVESTWLPRTFHNETRRSFSVAFLLCCDVTKTEISKLNLPAVELIDQLHERTTDRSSSHVTDRWPVWPELTIIWPLQTVSHGRSRLGWLNRNFIYIVATFGRRLCMHLNRAYARPQSNDDQCLFYSPWLWGRGIPPPLPFPSSLFPSP